ncbi:MAG: hypothetical protein SPD56_04105 [Alloprevotella sp.]|nr:hypothetical protein [Alloprevotella sp.]
MGLLDFLFGNSKEKERQEELERQRIAAEARKAQQRKEEQERQARIKKEQAVRARMMTIEPFVFKSNCHQRYEGAYPKMGLQECLRTVSVVKNTNGCSGYQLQPGDGYIIKIFNDDAGKPNMADKPMRVVRKTDTSVELRGYKVNAQTPFGWQEIDLADYGLLVHYENGKVCKCVLHMYDRNTFIEYRTQSNEPLKSVSSNHGTNECEEYAKLAREAAANGNTSSAQQYGLKALNSIIANPSQLKSIANVDTLALALGKMMEGDHFRDNDSIKRAVGLTYYMLCKAIDQNKQHDPYLFVYRFSVIWEYNQVFYHLFAHSEGTSYNPNPYDIFGQPSTAVYDHHMQGMQMGDMLQEPRVARLDPALGNIFNQMYARYRTTPSEQIISLGNKYHKQVYDYLCNKIDSLDLSF